MKNILTFTRKELNSFFKKEFTESKSYHTAELFKWIYRKNVLDFDLMTNFSKKLRVSLKEKLSVVQSHIDLIERDESDGTVKFRLKLFDGSFVESVIIRTDKRTTLCVSSQVGCAMACRFCLTALMGFKRNLTVNEIIDQLRFAEKIIKESNITGFEKEEHPISNIVFMGMGEPLNNIDEVGKAIDIMKDQMAFGYSKRRITVSTCGIADRILELPAHGDPNLAVSLNAVSDELRETLMPVNKRYPLKKLFNVLKAYPLERGRRITFEYILMKDVNDSIDDAKALIRLLKTVPSKINIICFNEFKGAAYRTSANEQVLLFTKYLLDNGIQANLRESKGKSISAACGLLAVK